LRTTQATCAGAIAVTSAGPVASAGMLAGWVEICFRATPSLRYAHVAGHATGSAKSAAASAALVLLDGVKKRRDRVQPGPP